MDNHADPDSPPIVGLGRRDLAEAVIILDAALGPGYVTDQELAGYIDGATKIALRSADSRSVATGELFPSVQDFLATQPGAHAEHLGRLMGSPEGPVGVVKSVAVHRGSRRQGLAGALVREAISQLAELGAKSLVSLGWTDAAGCHIQRVLESAGFRPSGDIECYWLEDSIAQGYACPTCGPSCACTARIFWRSV